MIASVIVASVEYRIIFIIWQVAFRAKAMQYHPDQNQNNKGELTLLVSDHLLFRKKKILPVILLVSFSTEAAEAKFKEVMASYDAIKLERKNRC